MKCPKCQSENKDSKVTYLSGVTTLAAVHIYIDKNNIKHEHDGNNISDEFICSEGHQWIHIYNNRCPQENCNWNNELRNDIEYKDEK